MGSVLTKTARKLARSRQRKKLIIMGLDNAGKTTILYKLKTDQVIPTIPTIGFNVEELWHKNRLFTVWDCGGHKNMRMLSRHYCAQADALIFVVDSDDTLRLDHNEDVDSAYDELWTLLGLPELEKAKLLVLANKQDLPKALSPMEVATKLGLYKLAGRDWYVQATSAVTGYGLVEGMEWLWTRFQGRKR